METKKTKEKKEYTGMKAAIIKFNSNDIIATSGTNPPSPPSSTCPPCGVS